MPIFLVLAAAVNAIFPILLLITLGYLLNKYCFLDDAFLKVGQKLIFQVCLPVMLFINVYETQSLSAIKWDVVVFVVAVLFGLFGIGYLAAIFTTKNPKRRGVIMQCCYRSNFAIIGIPIAEALGGSDSLRMMAILFAFTIPVFNIFAVISLTMFLEKDKSGKISIKKILRDICSNPLIIGVVSGAVAFGLRQLQQHFFGEVVFSLQTDTKFLYQALKQLASITSPLALIILGGQFRFSATGGMVKEIAVGTICRVILAPLIGIGLAVVLSTYTNVLSCDAADYPALVALFGSPVAVSSAIMAGAMKNDEQLATQLVVWTSLSSILTIFLMICLMLPAGLLSMA